MRSVTTDNRVALWDRHPEQPGGEVFIADAAVHEVARTPAVEQRIRDGSLVVVPDVAAKGKRGDVGPAPTPPDVAGEPATEGSPRSGTAVPVRRRGK